MALAGPLQEKEEHLEVSLVGKEGGAVVPAMNDVDASIRLEDASRSRHGERGSKLRSQQKSPQIVDSVTIGCVFCHPTLLLDREFSPASAVRGRTRVGPWSDPGPTP